MNPVLDARLEAVLELVQAQVHADIGSDHAHLPIRILRAGRASRCIAVELNPGPLAHSRRSAVRSGLGERLEVREGNGFDPLHAGEVDSASMTGMGTGTIVGVLQRAGDKLPAALVLQPNDSPRSIRQWACASGYHLMAERLMPGYWAYPVLRLERALGNDPAYVGVPLRAALRYGPHLLREQSPLLRQHIQEDLLRLTPLAAPGRNAYGELATAQEALAWLDDRRAEQNRQ
ncbi:tRNA (adenine-N(1))-methyltransferase [Deinococcus malanensis]|uniref:tRNA (Adenine-N(1))-methyltransferase n=1 Tax=Deinococcus malanensis TaxID=1706855 RepID=A0ABQ2F1W9_9DEIO|nr:tRNA (adenine(22)-N(1))-methyltransferase TrmK [Deinococcus malanensis]GGK40312.1 tRNA (adenine-N(1))-methyltransferase [Deinococcus malanensis]